MTRKLLPLAIVLSLWSASAQASGVASHHAVREDRQDGQRHAHEAAE